VGTPVYKSGHGWSNWDGGNYQLESSSPGFDKGMRLPNFNDAYAAPDMGAHQSGTSAMSFGVGGNASFWVSGAPVGSTSTSTSTTTSTSTSTSTSTATVLSGPALTQ
jgi:hypothetical protein